MTSTAPTAIKLVPRTDLIFHVVDREYGHIGNLKFASGKWKFKAVGYESDGAVIPGGGLFTHRHNVTVETPDAAELIQALT